MARHTAVLQRSVSRLVERHELRVAEPEVRAERSPLSFLLHLHCDAHDPPSCARTVHYEVKTVPIAVATGPETLH